MSNILLGTGKYGTVFLVERDDIQYAAKVEIHAKPNKVSQSSNELTMCKLLSTVDKIVTKVVDSYLDYPYVDNPQWSINILIMEYVEGVTLNTLYINGTLIHDVDRWRQIAINCINCIEYIHSKHVVHLDISVHNFILGADDQICIIDFGNSRRYETLKSMKFRGAHPYISIGTDPYKSINSDTCEVQGYNSDLESLMYVLWQLRTGLLPWEHATSPEQATYMKRNILKYSPPKEIIKMFNVIKGYGFRSIPDYAVIKACFV